MEYVKFSERILPKLADLVQRAFPLHEISLKTLRRITLEDPNFLPSDVVLAAEDGVLRGAAIGARYRRMPEDRTGNDAGFLKVICTVPHDGGLMHGMLERAIDGLRADGGRKLVYSNFASWHLLPGVDLRYENLLEFLRLADELGVSFAFPSTSVYVESTPERPLTPHESRSLRDLEAIAASFGPGGSRAQPAGVPFARSWSVMTSHSGCSLAENRSHCTEM